MKCPKCKIGELEYYANNFYVGCMRCDFRNGFVRFIRKFLTAQKEGGMTKTERELRKILLFNHGCVPLSIYGDDGEMQCHTCGSDFLRQSLTRIADNIDNPNPANFYKKEGV
jgi:hypothetical protein